MFVFLAVLTAAATVVSSASVPRGGHHQSVWQASNYRSLLAFGDSYTDENRLSYFGSHNGSAPPAGTFLPESFNTPGGGRTWPRYVVQYTGRDINGQWTPSMTLYNYAVSGAVCSNYISPRTFTAIDADFPSVLEYEISAFLADKKATRNGTSEAYFTPALSAPDSVYAMWIGTNDLGVDAFLTDSQVPGKVLTDYTECVYQSLDHLYAAGARVFVLFNTVPLQLAPLYANTSINGVTETHYWPMMPSNKTQIAEIMHEYTTTVNGVYKYQTPFEALVSLRYPGASFANFDVWSLVSDIYNSPTTYLNGTEPPNVSGFEHRCSGEGDAEVCTDEYDGQSPDSFLWFDELHPSEQTDRIIARNFIEVLNGDSKYAAYY